MVASRPESGPDAAVDAIRKARPDLYTFSNDEVIERFERVGFSYSGRFPRTGVRDAVVRHRADHRAADGIREPAARRDRGPARDRLLARRIAADVLCGVGAAGRHRRCAVASARRRSRSWLDRSCGRCPASRRRCTSSSSSRGRWCCTRRCSRTALRRGLPDRLVARAADCRHAPAGGRRESPPIVEARDIWRVFPMPAGPVAASAT